MYIQFILSILTQCSQIFYSSKRGIPMQRTFISFIGSFFLVFIEVYLVLLIKGYETIEFGTIGPFISVWAMNFFLLFSILTDVKMYLDEKKENETNNYSH